ncbi:MAG TPA: hypothetical protein VLJ62_18845, partial [Burkholderiaceae bacterium]|nr:hypothetical protein [Burkholderiaceae bacterium]
MLVGRAATPCMAGPRRDGYGVRHRLLSQSPAGFPALNGLAALRKTTLCASLRSNKFCEHETVASQATLGRKTVHRGRLCFIRAAARPCTVLRGGRRV